MLYEHFVFDGKRNMYTLIHMLQLAPGITGGLQSYLSSACRLICAMNSKTILRFRKD